MKTLFIIPYVPSKVRVRPYQIIRHFKERGHQVTLATIVTNQQEQIELDQFRQYCDEVITTRLPAYKSLINCVLALPTKLPLQSVYSWDAKLFSSIWEKIFANGNQPVYDLVHIEHLRGSQYGVRLLEQKAGRKMPPIVWDSVDCISYLFKQASKKSQQGFSRRITQFDLHRTERREGWLTNLFDRVLVTSQKDKKALSALAAHDSGTLEIVPNGVDLDYFQPGDFKDREKATLVISGKMSYHANVNMVLFLANDVMPKVWQSRPDIKLWVVGKDPRPEIQELAQLPTVTVTGTVDSMLPYLQRATIAVAPIQYGAGIQNKVLEAMACSTPVIASSLATSALSIVPGKEALVADTPQEWTAAILDLVASPERQRQIGEAGRQYVDSNHRWSEIVGRLDDLYASIISKSGNLYDPQ